MRKKRKKRINNSDNDVKLPLINCGSALSEVDDAIGVPLVTSLPGDERVVEEVVVVGTLS